MGCIQMIGATKLLQTVFLSTLRVKSKETSMDQPTVLFTFKMRANLLKIYLIRQRRNEKNEIH